MAISRENFLRTGLLGGLGLAWTPTRSAQPAGMDDVRITAVKVFPLRKATYVKLETNAGVSGWGEGDHDHPRMVAAAIEQVCRRYVEGQNPFDSEHIWMQMYFQGYDLGNSGLLPGAIAGIDNALWDLKGRLLGVPVYRLLGGNKVDKVRVYGSFGRSGGAQGQRTAAEMAAVAADFVAQGYRTVKARMQIRQLNVDPDPDETYAIVKAVRQAIGDEIELFVDFNNGYTPARAISLGLKLYEHFNIAALEEPVTQQQYASLRQVVEALPIPVMAGEHDYNKWQMRDLITQGMVDIVNLDTIKCGGLTECHKVASMAHAFDRPVMMHNTRPTLATAASLHLIASMPNAARVQEYAGPRPELNLDGLFAEPLRMEAGYLYLPEGPGLGMTAIEKEIARRIH